MSTHYDHLLKRATHYKIIKPVQDSEERGNDRYWEMLYNLRDLLEAAETQANHIEHQARIMRKGSPTGPDWIPTMKWSLKLTNTLYRLRNRLPL